jgi:hypothetical protein
MPATPLGSGTVPGSATARIRAALALALTPATVAPFVALAGIAVVAIVLRFYALAANPGGLYGDEAAEGLDAWRLLHQPGFHADFGVWFASDGGREALFAYVVAGVFNFAGASVVALRATAAAFGVAGVLTIGHLGRRFGIWTGVVAAAWAAGSLWLVAVSRDGMRNAIVPLFGALALLALLRWADKPGRWTAAAAGAVTAVAAMYTYQPLKLLPVLLVVWLLWLRRMDRPTYERLRADAVPFAIAFLVVAAPMIAVAVTNPTNYFGRLASASAFNPGVEADSNPIVHVLRTVAMFGLTGDPNARHDVAGLPLLPVPLSVVAVAGLVRLWRMRRDPGTARLPRRAARGDGRRLAPFPASARSGGAARCRDRTRSPGDRRAGASTLEPRGELAGDRRCGGDPDRGCPLERVGVFHQAAGRPLFRL